MLSPACVPKQQWTTESSAAARAAPHRAASTLRQRLSRHLPVRLSFHDIGGFNHSEKAAGTVKSSDFNAAGANRDIARAHHFVMLCQCTLPT